MKKIKVFAVIAFVLAIGTAFVTKANSSSAFATAYGTYQGSACTQGTITNTQSCNTSAGTQCTVRITVSGQDRDVPAWNQSNCTEALSFQ